jgi:hypothetical protein
LDGVSRHSPSSLLNTLVGHDDGDLAPVSLAGV